jgi:hypothetical protein
MRTRGWMVAAIAASCTACALIAGIQPPVDRSADSGSEVGVPGDGEPMEGGAPDGSADAPNDATPDGPWCQTHGPHTYCFDFDEVFDPTANFTSNNISGGAGDGAVQADPMHWRSPPRSMLSSVANGDDQGCTFAVVWKQVTSTASVIDVGLDILPDYDSTYDAGAGLLTLNVDSFQIGVGLANPQSSYVSWSYTTEAGYMSGGAPAQPIPAATWTRIDMRIAFGPPCTVTLSYDGAVQEQKVFGGDVGIAVGAQHMMNTTIGVVECNDAAAPFAANYDDLTIDIQ